MKKKLKPFDKYEYYLKAVQSPEADADFLAETYAKIRKKSARILREDFCGTFALCKSWIGRSKQNIAFGVDLDPEPLRWGMENFFKKLDLDDRKRLVPIQASVLQKNLPRADIISAMNFSYFFFRDRKTMKNYFQNCLKNLNTNGLLILDALGGSEYQHINHQSDRMGSFTYHWEQTYFNPIHQHAKFAMHFKRNGESMRKNVFKYEWRLWTLPELRELLEEVGFRKTQVFWEGVDRKGEGNGIFKISEVGEDSQSWICYLVASK